MERIEQNIHTSGLVTELTNSQAKNLTIIQRQWEAFNQALKKNNIYQSRSNWKKYGITFKIDEKYYYLTAIPEGDFVIPMQFTRKIIPNGDYKVFIHKGKMTNIKRTYYDIYKSIMPELNFEKESHLKTGFLHFEQYDYRFQWNKPSSEIQIYLPIETW